MSIICIGLDYHRADVALRGKVSFTETKYKDVYEKLAKFLGIEGCVILSTCNRTELFINHPGIARNVSVIHDFLMRYFALEKEDMDKFFTLEGNHAVRHLFRVASGLESMVIGEDQILNQVKEAQNKAIAYHSADTVLNKLFREAITCAKEIKCKTAISENKLSVASIAVAIIEDEMENLSNKSALIVGVGEMSITTIKYLLGKGIGKLYVANRTIEKAKPLIEVHEHLDFIHFDERYTLINQVDLVVSATGAPHIIFDYDKLKECYEGKSLLMIDMAVPRDIDERIRQLTSVKVYDMDDFKKIAEKNAALRQTLVEAAEKIVETYYLKMIDWLDEQDINKLLSKVDGYVDKSLSKQADDLMYKLDLDESVDRADAKNYALHLSNRMLKKMILKLKTMPPEECSQYIALMDALLE